MADAPTWDSTSPVEADKSAPTWDNTQPVVGGMEAAGRGLAEGASFGYANRLEAMTQAGGAKPYEGNVGDLAKGMYKYWTGDKGTEETYNAALERENASKKAAQEQHPYIYGGSELAGAVPAMAVMPELGAENVLARGAIAGGEYGALQGSSEGNDVGTRLANTGIGGATGAAAGAVGSAVGKGLEWAGSKVIDPLAQMYRGWKDPAGEAASRLQQALSLDQDAIAAGKAKGMTPQEWIAAKQAGEPVTLADLGAANTQSLLRSAANTSPDARNLLEQVLEDRFLSQSARTQETIRNLVRGGANAGKTADQIVAEYEAGRAPIYKNAFSQPSAQSVWDGDIEQMTQSPIVQNAIRGANLTAKDQAAKLGLTPMKDNPFVADANGRMTLRDPNFVPNLQYWDAVKKNLDQMGQEGQFWARTLRNHLDTITPEYKDARGFAANYFNESNALDAGRKLAGKKVAPDDISRAMRKMDPSEQELFREGYASDWADRVVGNMSKTRSIEKAMFNDINDAKRAEAVFGPAGLKKVQDRITLEAAMNGAYKAMGNSTTARQLIEAGLAGGAVGAYNFWETGSPWEAAKGVMQGAGAATVFRPMLAASAKKITGYVDGNVARNVAQWLTSDNPADVTKAVRMAQSNPKIMNGLRRIANAVVRSPAAPTSAGAGRLMVYRGPLTGSAPAAAQGDQNQGVGLGGNQPNQGPEGRAHGGRVSPKARAEKALPPNHKLGMRVPKGGSSCASCKYLASSTRCGNRGFIKWNKSAILPAPKDQYCCDLYIHSTKRAAGGAVFRAIKGYADGGAPDEIDDPAPQNAGVGATENPQISDNGAAPAPSYWDRAKAMMTGSGPIKTSTGVTITPEDIDKGMNLGLSFSGGGLGTEEVMAAKNPIWRSQVEDTVAASPMKAAPAEQWAGTLKNAKGVKPEEMDWLGLNDFLASKAGQKVSKDDILQHIAGNKVELQDVHRGARWPTNDAETQELAALEKRFADKDMSLKLDDAGRLAELRMRNVQLPIAGMNTKYQSYQLPGGENYREHLLTLPEKVVRSPRGEEETARLDAAANYRSSHWDEPNVLAHVRSNDRVMDSPDGPKKTLHLEEIQSDWHQQGRQKGYDTPINVAQKPLDAETARQIGLPAGTERYVAERNGRVIGVGETEAEARQYAGTATKLVPDAPFKDTDAWAGLAMKRMIRHAAENGYDRISWTPGEAQAARYDLSKQVDHLLYQKNPDGTFKVSAQIQGRGQMLGDKLNESQLADHVGKEVAEKIANGAGEKQNLGGNSTSQPPDHWNKLSGVDLKVGGEGMREFYDKMLPKIAEKIGKQHGVKVKEGEIPSSTRGGDNAMQDQLNDMIEEGGGTPTHAKRPINQSVHYFDIPPSLKQQALKGLPMFFRGGRVKPPKPLNVSPALRTAYRAKSG